METRAELKLKFKSQISNQVISNSQINNAELSNDLARQIRMHGTTHLLFGVGAPKSEIWIDRHRTQVGNCYALSVGAGLDFFAGTKRRAPRWMRQIGMEWSWRLAQEPKRLWHRYTVHSWRFLAAIRKDLAKDFAVKAMP